MFDSNDKRSKLIKMNTPISLATEIVAISLLLEKGFKIAFVKGNRAVTAKNVSSKKTSFKNFGMNLVPLMYVKGTKAISDGCEIVDMSGNDIDSSKASEYIVILDGQHRITAALEMGLDLSKIFAFESYSDALTKDQLSESNIEVDGWKSTAWVDGFALFNPKNELAIKAKELSDKNYPISNISLNLCFNKTLTAKALSQLMKGEKLKIQYDIERANYYEKSTSKFSDKFLAKRYLIEAVIELSTTHGYRLVCDALAGVSNDVVKRLEKTKSGEISEAIRTALIAGLTK